MEPHADTVPFGDGHYRFDEVRVIVPDLFCIKRQTVGSGLWRRQIPDGKTGGFCASASFSQAGPNFFIKWKNKCIDKGEPL